MAQLDKALSNLIWSHSRPWFEQNLGEATSWGSFQLELSFDSFFFYVVYIVSTNHFLFYRLICEKLPYFSTTLHLPLIFVKKLVLWKRCSIYQLFHWVQCSIVISNAVLNDFNLRFSIPSALQPNEWQQEV